MNKLAHSILLTFTLLTISACETHIHNSGHSFSGEDISKIKVNKTTKGELVSMFGTPTSMDNVGEKAYIYANIFQESKLFFKPTTVSQEILLVYFDDQDKVKELYTYGTQDFKNIKVAKEYTKLKGNEIGFMEQMLGNLGKFNNPATNRPR